MKICKISLTLCPISVKTTVLLDIEENDVEEDDNLANGDLVVN